MFPQSPTTEVTLRLGTGTGTASGAPSVAPVEERSHQRGCPMCAAPLVEMRGQARCSRCCFVFCVGCEGGSGEVSEE